jgi:hypothetical protein
MSRRDIVPLGPDRLWKVYAQREKKGWLRVEVDVLVEAGEITPSHAKLEDVVDKLRLGLARAYSFEG